MLLRLQDDPSLLPKNDSYLESVCYDSICFGGYDNLGSGFGGGCATSYEILPSVYLIFSFSEDFVFITKCPGGGMTKYLVWRIMLLRSV